MSDAGESSPIHFTVYNSNRHRRNVVYLTKFVKNRARFLHLLAINIGYPVLGIGLLQGNNLARIIGIGAVSVWAVLNRWADPLWRVRLRALKQTEPESFVQSMTIDLAEEGFGIGDEDGGHRVPWGYFTEVAVMRNTIVVMGEDSTPLGFECATGKQTEAVLAYIEANTGLVTYRPNPMLVTMAIGPNSWSKGPDLPAAG